MIPNAQLQTNVAEAMERAARGIRKAHSRAESIGDTQFISVLDCLHIGSMTIIRNLEALKHPVSELEGLAGQPAAQSPCDRPTERRQRWCALRRAPEIPPRTSIRMSLTAARRKHPRHGKVLRNERY